MLEQRLKVVKARLPDPFKTLIIHFFNQDFFEKATVDRRRVFVKGYEIFTDFLLNQEIHGFSFGNKLKFLCIYSNSLIRIF